MIEFDLRSVYFETVPLNEGRHSRAASGGRRKVVSLKKLCDGERLGVESDQRAELRRIGVARRTNGLLGSDK